MTGIFCLKALLVLVGAFLAVDLWAWLTGQSLSQWVIVEKERSLFSRLLILTLIVAVAVFLIFHFELLR